ncbi:hypothetical protein PINS_up003236 [Pythium insidiosum]|nr:hypothetical protein PINS_up003236 [Pythium insidiosum]
MAARAASPHVDDKDSDSSYVDESSDEATAKQPTTPASRKRRTKTIISVNAKKGRGTNWSEQQKKTWLRVEASCKKDKRPLEEAVAEYETICTKKGWPIRSQEACRQKSKKLKMSDTEYKWTLEQMRLVYDAYRKQKLTRKEVASLYDTHAKENGWPERSETTIMAKVYRLTDKDFAIMDSAAQNPATKNKIEPWTEEQDAMVRQWLRHTRNQLARDQLVLAEYMRKHDPNCKERTLAAIQRRIIILKEERAKNQVRFWGNIENEAAQELIESSASVDDVALKLATKFHVPLWFAKGRVIAVYKKSKRQLPL